MTSHYLRYSLYSFFRLQIRLTIGTFGVAAVVLDIAALIGLRGGNPQSPGLVFAAFFTLCVLWITYWFGFRVAYSLEVRDGRTLMARGDSLGRHLGSGDQFDWCLGVAVRCRGNPHG